LRHATLALILAFVAGLAAAAPVPGNHVAAAAAATVHPKVVIVVGAVHGQTDSYRLRGEAAYAEAIKYTPNVVKVFSPNATWTAVKAAAQGASILIYMGHGNGWPSPYTYDPAYTTKDGFGLNSAAGQGDHNNKYYGEPSIATLGLAPNAVVLLHHLCYAAGNSEPGHAEPSLSVAKQRADNYASAFLRAGARAVVADGHLGAAYYIRALFTTRQTVDQMWRGAPNFHANNFSFASVRSPGYTVQMDPELPTSRFYRAITGKMTLRTDEVTGAAYAATDTNPVAFTIPGAASVRTAGAGLFADQALTPDPVATLPLDARVRVLAGAGTTPTGAAIYRVRTLDGSAEGFMSAANLTPRDSTSPAVWELDDEAGAFSPNADTRQDTVRISGRFSETAAWRLTFAGAAGIVAESTGSGTTFAGTWNGTSAGATVPDGSYAWTLTGTDGWGNPPVTRTGNVVVDTVAPALGPTAAGATASVPTLTPNADGNADTLALGYSTNEAGAIDLTITSATAAVVRTASAAAKVGAGTVSWDGRNGSGAVVPDGKYTARLAPRDVAGNVGAAAERQIWVYASLSKVLSAPVIFYPQDNDRFSTYSTLSFVLARAATVTWRITKLDGTIVRTIKEQAALAAGIHTYKWYGQDAAGLRVPAGIYAVVATASNGTVWASQKTWVETNAFSYKLSDTTPARGQTVTVTTTAAETLKAAPVLRVAQPGIAAWSVTMRKVSGNTWTASIKLKSSSTGQVLLRISGYDLDGRWQLTYKGLPLG
jgi:flagellar hook assembly protein FlgD